MDLAKLWGEARYAELGGLEWVGKFGLSPGKVAEVAERVREMPQLRRYLVPTMRQFWAEVKAGQLPEAKAYVDNAAFAFGAWASRFGPYAERIAGAAPAVVAGPQNGVPGARGTPAEEYRPMPE